MSLNSSAEKRFTIWIHHFENQASKGISPRSTWNNNLIVVQDDKNKTPSLKQIESTTQIVSPVEQIVQQAESSILREHQDSLNDNFIKKEDFDFKIDKTNKKSVSSKGCKRKHIFESPCNKKKRSVNKKSKVYDIFNTIWQKRRK